MTKEVNEEHFELYRDDGLIHPHSFIEIKVNSKEKIKIYDLNMDVAYEFKVLYFLDAPFNYNTGVWQPLRKPNNQPS